ncbi:MAG TPA: 2-C-methyl-D-erythritol 2,4-cyclodiphosphate synthase [Clostridiales bacterium]|nr:2-C-methyl-D-erythritol 2,4-cyclodiphosphate synthase [Clostridiales bacterium]
MRIGVGYDVHAMVEGRRLVLGGVDIPFQRGLLGHSDADVLVHSIIDALLGAMALGDIGQHFPDTDPKYKDISSLRLLETVKEKLKINGLKVGNIDASLVMEKPKISPYIMKMRKNISSVLGIDISRVNIKATTTEGLGFTGTGEGVACYSVVLLTTQ